MLTDSPPTARVSLGVRTILRSEALAFEARSFTVAEIVVAGVASGRWPALEDESARGVAALEAAGDPPADDRRDAANAFRYERSLLAREDLERWLEERSLTMQDWLGHIRRRLARQLAPDAHDADATPVLRADAICSGVLRACADDLIAGAAAARAVGVHEADTSAVDDLVRSARATIALAEVDETMLNEYARVVVELETARRRLEHEAVAGDAVPERVRANALGWLSFETEELTSPSEDAAREARLCVREDGATLAEVAGELRTKLFERTRVFADTDAELASRLAAASPGELVGPLASDDGYLLARLRAKRPPSVDDPLVVERARTELVAETIARNAAGRVTWYVAL
jgi:hypothetical protein